MLPFVIPALASVAAAGIGAATSAWGQHKANEDNKAASAAQMAFQERMSNTQYQRVMTDMRGAGLNPMLAYQQGGAGGAPGASYQAGNVGAAAVSGAGSAYETFRRQRMEQNEFDLSGAQVDIANQTAQNLIDQRKLINAQATQSAATASREHATTAILREDLQSAKAAAEAAKTDQEFYKSEGGQFLRNLERISRSILPAGQTARTVR